MKIGRGMAVQRHLGQLFDGQSVAGLGEVQLLERFVERRDGPAFAALVARHGPMVLGVCRRLLADPLDVEDAFQATFLVLVRRAGSLRDRDRLAPWLFGVARRVATRARADLARRRAREKSGVEEFTALSGLDDPTRELGRALVEEIDRLPGTLREPILLCCVEGLTYDEAASQLRSTAPAIRGRLARARGCLKDRLTRRGFAPTVATLGALLSAEGASAAVPPRLLLTTFQVAKAGAVPAGVDILAEGVIRTMILTKSKILAAAVVACGVAGSSMGLVAQDGRSPEKTAPIASPEKTAEADRLDQVEKKLDRLLQALEGKSNRSTAQPPVPPTPAQPPVPPTPTQAPLPPVPPVPPQPPTRVASAAEINLAKKKLIESIAKGADPKEVLATLKLFPDQPPVPPAALEALKSLDANARALIEGLPKGAEIEDVHVSVEVLSDQPPAPGSPDPLNPATRAIVERVTKGLDLKGRKGEVIILEKDGQRVVLGPDQIKINKAPLPADVFQDALKRKIEDLETRLLKLERKLGMESRSERSPEEAIPGMTDAIRKIYRSSRRTTTKSSSKTGEPKPAEANKSSDAQSADAPR